MFGDARNLVSKDSRTQIFPPLGAREGGRDPPNEAGIGKFELAFCHKHPKFD